MENINFFWTDNPNIAISGDMKYRIEVIENSYGLKYYTMREIKTGKSIIPTTYDINAALNFAREKLGQHCWFPNSYNCKWIPQAKESKS